MRHLAVLALLGLTACSNNISIASMDGTDVGQGTAAGIGLGLGRGTMTIEINDRVYTGQWVLVSSDSTGFVNIFGTDGTFTTGTVTTTGGAGAGNAILNSAGGGSLHCTFQYGDLTGVGTCQDEGGRQYSIQITGL